MREQFGAYFDPSDETLQKLWDEAVFSFDASALLNVYRYTPELRERLFQILSAYKERIWLTHQAAEEYFANRERVIQDQLGAYKKLGSLFEKLPTDIGKTLDAYAPHPYIDTRVINEQAKTLSQSIANTSVISKRSTTIFYAMTSLEKSS